MKVISKLEWLIYCIYSIRNFFLALFIWFSVENLGTFWSVLISLLDLKKKKKLKKKKDNGENGKSRLRVLVRELHRAE